MIRIIFSFLLTGIFFSHTIQSQDINWVIQKSGSKSQYGNSCTYDISGNLIYGATDQGSNNKLFFGKVSPDGKAVFNFDLTGPTWGAMSAVEMDTENNIFFTGYFDKTVDFDPGSATRSLSAGTSWRIFVAKYDSGGKYLWAKKFGGGAESYGRGLALDHSGNVIVCGKWDEKIFFLKLDNNGTEVFTKVLNCKPKYSSAYDVEVDQQNNIYVSGHIDDSVDFDPDTAGTYFISKEGPFLAKYDSLGNLLWVVSGASNSGTSWDIEMDGQGHIYMVGSFRSTLNFTGNNSKLVYAVGSSDIFIAKFDTGGACHWQHGFGGSTYDYGYALTVANDTTLFFGGSVRDSVNFGNGNLYINSLFADDPFVAKFDSTGTVRGVLHFPCSSFGGLNDLANYKGQLGMAGYFEGNIDFAPNQPGYDFYSGGSFSTDAFIAGFCLRELGPVGVISGPDTICAESTDTLIFSVPAVTNATNYQWLLPAGFVFAGDSTANLIRVMTIAGAKTGVFRVVARGGCATPDTSDPRIVVVPVNNITLTDLNPLGTCVDEDVRIVTGKVDTFDLYVNSVFYQTLSTDTFTVSGQQNNFSLYAKYTDNSGCSQQTPVLQVKMVNPPAVKLVTDKPSGEVCQGEPVSFTASGADTLYIYKNKSRVGGASWVADSIINTDYFYATGITMEGCRGGSDTVSLIVNPLPVPGLAADDSDLTIVSGQPITFMATGGDRYDFYKNGIMEQSSTDSNFQILMPKDGDEVFVTVIRKGCSANSPKLTLTVLTGMKEQKEKNFLIYPVPVEEQLHIVLRQEGTYTVILTDFQGRTLIRRKENFVSGQELMFDLTPYKRAGYLLNIISEDGMAVFLIPHG